MRWIIVIFAISSLSAFFLSLLNKWDVIEWVQVHGNKFFAQMFSCWFCLSFWANMVICILCSIVEYNLIYLLFPLITTSLTKKLL